MNELPPATAAAATAAEAVRTLNHLTMDPAATDLAELYAVIGQLHGSPNGSPRPSTSAPTSSSAPPAASTTASTTATTPTT